MWVGFVSLSSAAAHSFARRAVAISSLRGRATMTCAGRITRSCNKYPSCATVSTVCGGKSFVGCCKMASCKCGSKGLCSASMRVQLCRASTLSSCCLTSLNPSSKLPLGGRRGSVDRALDIIQYRQKIAEQSQVRIATFVFQLATGPLAIVFPFGLQSECAVSLRSSWARSSAASPPRASAFSAPGCSLPKDAE